MGFWNYPLIKSASKVHGILQLSQHRKYTSVCSCINRIKSSQNTHMGTYLHEYKGTNYSKKSR